MKTTKAKDAHRKTAERIVLKWHSQRVGTPVKREWALDNHAANTALVTAITRALRRKR